MADIKNVFISHVHKDDHGLQKLKDLPAPKGIDVKFSGSNFLLDHETNY